MQLFVIMKKSLFRITVLMIALVGQSRAGTWSFDYSGAGVSASVTVTTDTALTTFEGNSGYYITGVSGQRNGVAITSLIPATIDAASGYSTSADGRWWFDNVLLSSGGFDLYGLLFMTQDGGEYNFYKDHGQYIDGYFNKDIGGYNLVPVSMSVPEGGIPLAMVGGVLIGLAMLRRRFSN